jgi:hypothetical protein
MQWAFIAGGVLVCVLAGTIAMTMARGKTGR